MRQCKSRAIVVVITAGLAVAGTAQAEPPRLDLVWVDPAGVARGTYSAVASESRAVLAGLGADVHWTAASPGAVMGPESLVVIAVPSYPNSGGRERHVMGATRKVADGALAVWVFPDQVAWALGLDLDMRATWGKGAEASFGRALARVASHEVVHALGSPVHAHAGLMTATLDRQALTAPTMRIDGPTIATVRRIFASGPLAMSGPRSLPLLREAPIARAAELAAGRGSSR